MSIIEHRHLSDDAMVLGLAQDISQRLAQAIKDRGQALLCVSGGKSPIPLLKALSTLTLDWNRVTVSLVDERCVSPEHPDSNEGLVRRHLLHGAAKAANFVPWVPSEFPASGPGYPAWTQAALLYQSWIAKIEESLRPLWPADVVVLGMGMDGHTASIFSQAAGLDAAIGQGDARLICALRPPHAPYDRLTLTLSALETARHCILQISGAGKQQVLALARQHVGHQRPVSLLLNVAAHRAQPDMAIWIGD